MKESIENKKENRKKSNKDKIKDCLLTYRLLFILTMGIIYLTTLLIRIFT